MTDRVPQEVVEAAVKQRIDRLYGRREWESWGLDKRAERTGFVRAEVEKAYQVLGDPVQAIREAVLVEVREKLEGAKSVEAAAAALHDWREKDDPTGPIEESADPEYRRREPLWWDEMVAAGRFPGTQKEIREEAIAMLAAVIALATLKEEGGGSGAGSADVRERAAVLGKDTGAASTFPHIEGGDAHGKPCRDDGERTDSTRVAEAAPDSSGAASETYGVASTSPEEAGAPGDSSGSGEGPEPERARFEIESTPAGYRWLFRVDGDIWCTSDPRRFFSRDRANEAIHDLMHAIDSAACGIHPDIIDIPEDRLTKLVLGARDELADESATHPIEGETARLPEEGPTDGAGECEAGVICVRDIPEENRRVYSHDCADGGGEWSVPLDDCPVPAERDCELCGRTEPVWTLKHDPTGCPDCAEQVEGGEDWRLRGCDGSGVLKFEGPANTSPKCRGCPKCDPATPEVEEGGQERDCECGHDLLEHRSRSSNCEAAGCECELYEPTEEGR